MAGRDLVLTGPMGAGKTTTGRTLSRLLGYRFSDLDGLIAEREGSSVSELFAQGETVFRDAEGRAARSWLEDGEAGAPRVLALGGGSLIDGSLAETLARRATLVHLDAPAEQLALRIGPERGGDRPLIASARHAASTLERLRHERANGYAQAALTIDTSGLDTEEAAVATLRALHDPRGGPWREGPRPLAGDAAFGSGVTIGRGAFPASRAAVVVAVWDDGLPAVHERAVAPLAAAAARDRYVPLGIVGGEASKTAATLLDVWRRLLDAGLDRDTPVHVVGGGSVCDVAGLAAHTFKRGVPLKLHPTTLVAQLDAALGGKTAINLAGIKNVIGTIRLPDAVHVDPLFLPTLSPADLSSGLGEAVKSAIVGDTELFSYMEKRAPALVDRSLVALEQVVERAARVKLRVVSEDLDDHGVRRHLNLGHTLGHALESLTAGSGHAMTHGEAVAVGISFSARLARRVGVLDETELPERIDALLTALGLPSRPPELAESDRDVVRAALVQDKKRRQGHSAWVLPRCRGEVV
ncbi:MAG: bifunctional shikimate kinase/3-dehydroquinate synthase, partial [Acidobacteriota bacterium]|nr:bifunctional shikimate kinase/3-dehydroquinate synthase [Acidobacteriota bacterium]